METTEWTDRIGILALLDGDRKRWLMARASTRTKQRGEHIYYPDEESGHVVFIGSGRVKVGTFATDGRETIRFLAYPGDMIGHQALNMESLRREFAIALDDEVTFHLVNAEDMLTLMRSGTDFAVDVMRFMAESFHKAQQRCEGIIFSDARTRIVETVREMAVSHGQVLAGGSVLISHALTHQDFALLTATSRQTVTTVLNELKDSEIINFDRRSILIHEMANLV